MYQKLILKCPKNGQKSILEGSPGVLGGYWRLIPKNMDDARFFGTLLGPSWRPLGPSWRPLGAVLAVLAASWARLGLVLAAEIGPQVDQISTPKSIRTLMPLGIDFLEDFGGFYFPKWSQDASKNLLEIDVNLERLFFQKPRFFLKKNNHFGGSGSPT